MRFAVAVIVVGVPLLRQRHSTARRRTTPTTPRSMPVAQA